MEAIAQTFMYTKDMMTVIFIVMVDNCLLSKSSDKDVHQLVEVSSHDFLKPEFWINLK